LIAWLQVLLRI